MKFKEHLTEILNLDKSLKGISKLGRYTWIFYINNNKYRVFITEMGIDVNNTYYKGYEIFLQVWNDKKGWNTKHFESNINAGVLGGKLISILYDIIKTYNPKIFSMRAYNINLEHLYDLIWSRYDKISPFDEYTKYTKDIMNNKLYTFAKGLNEQEDLFMFDNYMEVS